MVELKIAKILAVQATVQPFKNCSASAVIAMQVPTSINSFQQDKYCMCLKLTLMPQMARRSEIRTAGSLKMRARRC